MQMTLSNAWNFILIPISLKYCSFGSNWQVSIGSGNNLASSKWHAFTWTRVDHDICHHMASLGHNESVNQWDKINSWSDPRSHQLFWMTSSFSQSLMASYTWEDYMFQSFQSPLWLLMAWPSAVTGMTRLGCCVYTGPSLDRPNFILFFFIFLFFKFYITPYLICWNIPECDLKHETKNKPRLCKCMWIIVFPIKTKLCISVSLYFSTPQPI